MAAKKHLLHIRSSVINKVPTSNDLEYGEIAVNYAKGGETLYIKNNQDEIVSFPNTKVIEDNELVVAASLTDLNDRVETLEAKENDYVTIVNNTEIIKANRYTIIDSENANITINLEQKNATEEKTYVINFDKSLLPNLTSITWPNNLIWEGHNEPDVNDFNTLGYLHWIVTINNGNLASYKRYW